MRKLIVRTTLQFMAIVYLLGFMIIQLSSSTTTSFHDEVVVGSRLSSAIDFEENKVVGDPKIFESN